MNMYHLPGWGPRVCQDCYDNLSLSQKRGASSVEYNQSADDMMSDLVCDNCQRVVLGKTTNLVERARYAVQSHTAQKYIDTCHAQKTGVDWSVVAFLTMYDTRTMWFTIGFTVDQAVTACRGLGSYNEFDGDKVAAFVRSVDRALNDKRPVRFEVGRQYSPVLLVSVTSWNTTLDEFSGAVKHYALLHDIRAEEFDAQVTDGGAALTARLWWD